MASDVRQNDVGVAIRLTVKDQDGAVVNVAAATEITFTFQKPDETTVEKDGSLSGSGADGNVQYVTEAGFLDQPGGWTYDVRVAVGALRVTSEPVKFKVGDVVG